MNLRLRENASHAHGMHGTCGSQLRADLDISTLSFPSPSMPHMRESLPAWREGALELTRPAVDELLLRPRAVATRAHDDSHAATAPQAKWSSMRLALGAGWPTPLDPAPSRCSRVRLCFCLTTGARSSRSWRHQSRLVALAQRNSPTLVPEALLSWVRSRALRQRRAHNAQGRRCCCPTNVNRMSKFALAITTRI